MDLKTFFRRPGRFLVLWLLVCTAAMVVAAWFYYERQRETVVGDTLTQLAAIADFKAQQIANWRSERIGDGRVLAASPLMESVRRVLSQSKPAEADRAAILPVMEQLSRAFLYTDAAVVDLSGVVRLRLHEERGDDYQNANAFLRQLSQQATKAGDVVLSDLTRIAPAARPRMMLAIPVRDLGAMILEIDPDAFLYPYLKSWPTPTQTAETLLIRRDGDSVLELSPMKYRSNAELAVGGRAPRSLPGESVLAAGWLRRDKDYRGVQILGVVKRVPDSLWYLSVKIDRSEAEIPLHRLAWELAMVVALIALANAAGVGFVWRNRQVQALREREEWFRTVANDTPAYLWMSTADAQSSFLNKPMAKFFGIPDQQLDADWALTIHPEDREKDRDFYLECLAARREYVNEFRVRRSDGEYRWVIAQGIPRFSDQGEFLGYAGSLADITERRDAEAQLRQTNTVLAAELQERIKAEHEVHDLSARLIHAQEEERSRLARELHDDLSQQIAALNLGVFKLKGKVPTESEARIEVDKIQRKLVELAEHTRRLSHELHPGVLKHAGLATALQSYCEELAALASREITFASGDGCDVLPLEASLCVYRVAQEGLQNFIKHSQANKAEVTLKNQDGAIHLTVSDHGVGISPAAAGGLGLVSIKERTRLVNGTVEVVSRPGEGVTLRLRVPIPRAERAKI